MKDNKDQDDLPMEIKLWACCPNSPLDGCYGEWTGIDVIKCTSFDAKPSVLKRVIIKDDNTIHTEYLEECPNVVDTEFSLMCSETYMHKVKCYTEHVLFAGHYMELPVKHKDCTVTVTELNCLELTGVLDKPTYLIVVNGRDYEIESLLEDHPKLLEGLNNF